MIENTLTPAVEFRRKASQGTLTSEEISRFIQNGGNINGVSTNGNTPLHWAIDRNHLETAKLLVNHGAHIFIRNNAAETPMAKLSDSNKALKKEFMQLYIEKYMNISYTENSKDHLGKFALDNINSLINSSPFEESIGARLLNENDSEDLWTFRDVVDEYAQQNNIVNAGESFLKLERPTPLSENNNDDTAFSSKRRKMSQVFS